MTTPFPFQSGSVLQAQQLNDITNLPINDQTASYSLVVGDAGKRVVMDVATANTVTVDDSVFTTGDTIFIANKGAGASTLTAGAGVTINSASGLVLVQHQSGQLVALSASSFLFVASDVTASAGAIVQVLSTAKLDTFTTSSATFVDVTGLTVAITPTSASNKVLIVAQIAHGIGEAAPHGHFKLNGGNSSTYVGAAAGNRIRAVFGGFSNFSGQNTLNSSSIVFLDSPATTSATTYAVQVRAGTSGSVRINSSSTDSDNASVTRGASSITVFEVTP